ncbi:hypothetical protein J437_LFUL001423 [Ladona fulva]|uniref:Dynein assembly factor 3, axonemal n=1 Tax=Ladona fulva TaxID=123851 RepID=A0A8K0JUN6_LADFU|nr:hypothetical protein J437_LFUL001423 [Ladona fulva]
MWWGYSAALDLIEEQKLYLSNGARVQGSLHVLIIGGKDGRHIIKTLSEINRQGNQNMEIHFYVIEKSLELIARQMLLLTLALEPPQILGLQEKSVLFLEIFGNTVITPNAYNYIVNKSYQLVHMVTDLDYLKKRLPIVHIDSLKYRERDGLETIFNFWHQSPTKYLNIENLWDSRLRRLLTSRYDSKMGVFDWDYHMRFCTLGKTSVSSAEYKKWRLKGIAYSWFDRVVSQPNFTLISGAQKTNGDIISLGYRGDIENGPFATFGLQSKANEKYQRENPRKCAGYTLKNIMNVMQGIVNTKETICFPDMSELEGAVLIDDRQESLCNLTSSTEETVNKVMEREEYTAMVMGSSKVTFLPVSSLLKLHEKENFKEFFDIIVLSNDSMDSFNPSVMETAKNNAIVLVETLNFVLAPKKGDDKLFEEVINESAKKCNCKSITRLNDVDDFFKRFEFSRD